MLPLIIAGAVVLLLLLFIVLTYNNLVSKRNQVNNAWSQIDVQLKRRHDLVPNLVNAVKGYMTHEQAILDRVTQARQAAISAGGNVEQRAQAENQLTAGLRQLFAVAEAYPQLRASENMAQLQEELASTENRIAFARQFYSDAVTTYNTARETLPAALFASILGFKPATLFTLDDVSDRAVPQVQFS
ncbi:MAG: hypothetical protein DCC58_03005 [Chloroflexi bacterium]|nr:MAG: hypothetical protein DCC58_03005 [Chloroflexota bacterium]